ncbi:PAS domain S-box protein [candidate division KSB1 bacterium]
MKYKLSDLIDIEKSRKLLESFCEAVEIGAAIIDLEGNVLIGVRWQKICTDFHRVNETTCKKCIESDTEIANELEKGKKYTLYKCMNGMTDAAAPIIIEGEHVANAFVGQFLLGPPDFNYFKRQAKEVGFDEEEYLKALSEVPLASEKKVPYLMEFLVSFAETIAEIGLDSMRMKENKKELELQKHDLGERIKELNCLYGISKIIEKPGVSLDEMFQVIADLIPPGWQYPEKTCAKIILEEKEYKTENFRNTEWKQAAEITASGEKTGVIEVFYLEKMPEHDEGPFLKEERNLINAVSKRIGQVIEARNADRKIKEYRENLEKLVEQRTAEQQEAEEQSRLILDSAKDGIFGVDNRGIITFVNPAAVKLLKYSSEELIGKAVHDLIHHSHADNSPYDIKDCPMYHAYTEGSSSDVTDEILWCRDRTNFPVEYSSTPIKKDGELIGAVVTFKDITERKEAEEALKDSEETFRGITSAAQSAIIMASNDGNISFWNRAAEEIFGYKAEEVIGKDMHKLIAPERFVEQGIRSFRKYAKTGKGDRIGKTTELTGKRRDGTEFPFEVALSSVKLKGKWCAIGIINDITERKKAEEALIESSKQLQLILDNSPIGVAFSANKIMHFVNPRFTEMFGVETGDAAPDMYLNPNERDQIVKRLSDDGIVENYELQLFNKHREVIETVVTFLPFNYKGEDGILGWTMDITERKKAEEEIKELSEAVKQSPATVVITDKDGTIEYVNPRFEQVTGYTSEEAIGQNPRILNAGVQPKEYYKVMWETLIAGNVWSGELCNKKKNGDIFWESVSISPVRDDNGEIVKFVAVKEDITERKKAEKELKKANEIAVQSQQRLNALFEALPVGVTLISQTGEIQESNKIAQNILGVSADEHKMRELQSEKWLIIRPDGSDMPVEEYAASRTLAGEGLVKNVEMGVKRSDRKIVWINVSAAPVEDEAGSGAAVVFEDITERKKAEEELSLLNQLVYGSLESANVGAWWIDLSEEDTFHALDTTAKLIGVKPFDSVKKAFKISEWGKVLQDTAKLSPEFAEAIDNTFEKFTGTITGKYEKYGVEYPVKLKDGTIRWIDARADVPERDKDGKALIMTGTLIDITERKKAEAEIAHINMLSDNALDLTTAGFWIIDYSDPEYYTSSERAAKIFGEKPKKGWKYHLTKEWYSRIEAADRALAEETAEKYQGALDGKYDKYDAVYPYKRPVDGNVVWIRAIGDVVRNDKGEPLRMYGVAQDITDFVLAEKELEKNINELERFNKFAVGRELKMIKLKEEINEHLVRSGQTEKYKIVK